MSIFSFSDKDSIIELLPETRGPMIENAPLDDITWFGVGGSAQVLYRPEDEDDLADFMRGRPKNISVCVIGVGSNLLVRDGGILGVVVRLGIPFSKVDVDGELIKCGSSSLNSKIAQEAMKNGIGGFEFLSGIPGTIGGSVKMNAGSFGREMKDILVSATVVDDAGVKHEMTAEDLGFAHRTSIVPNNWVITGALLRGYKEDSDKIKNNMEEIRIKRQENQPQGVRTGGSTFKNPEGLSAWKLIEKAGCRGLKVGGAMVSNKHCNFIINTGGATAQDIENLGEKVRKRVKMATNIDLEWEIKRLGVAKK
jgi:UDP-N-acetylmuramate dehydrogenase